MKRSLRLLRFVLQHPLNRRSRFTALQRVVAWQLASRMMPVPMIVPFTSKTVLAIERGMTGATGNYYCGLHEFEDMAFVLNLLRPGDLFVDIGANVGTYTILASGHVGARTLSFEPIPSTFAHLQRNIALNQLESCVEAHNCGLGREPGNLRFTSGLDTINHVATESELNHTVIEVPVRTLDEVVGNREPFCMKLDVEGFEKQVIDGAPTVLSRPSLRAVLMELNGSGKRYGISDSVIHEQMLLQGFRPYLYDPFLRHLTALTQPSTESGNTLYLRDLELVSGRLLTAKAIELPWRSVSPPKSRDA